MTEITTRLADLPLSVLIPGILHCLLLLRRAAQYLPEKRINGVPLPPFVPDWIPFIGNALLLAKGDAAWASLQKQYGPAFRVRAMGDLRTFVCSPEVSPTRTGPGSELVEDTAATSCHHEHRLEAERYLPCDHS